MRMFVLVAVLVLVTGVAQASMILSGPSNFGPFSFTGEGNSYTHYTMPGDPASGLTGRSQEYFLTSAAPTFFMPDPQNYGLQISKGFLDSFPGVTAWDGGVSLGEFDWALSYYSPIPAASTGSPWHSVLYGTTSAETVTFNPANDGPGGVIDIAYGSATLNYDGIYHSVGNGPIVINPGASTFDLTVTLYEVGINASGQNEWSTEPIPEPSTALLVGLGLTGLAGKGRRRSRS